MAAYYFGVYSVAIIASMLLIRGCCVLRWGRCNSKRSMRGKTVVITGANSGLGKATAKELAKRGARVVLACRDPRKAQLAVDEIRRETSDGELVIKHLDLASLDSVRRFADDVRKTEDVDVLINNAGIFQCPYEVTQDGLEMQMAVNYVGHFLLTEWLMDTLRRRAPSRVVFVVSTLYRRARLDVGDLNSERGYDRRLAYNNSKMATVLYAGELHRRIAASGVAVYCASPGHVWTNLGRHVRVPWAKALLLFPLALLFVRTPAQGCQTIVHCAVSERLEGVSGRFYKNCQERERPPVENEVELARRLWIESERVTSQK